VRRPLLRRMAAARRADDGGSVTLFLVFFSIGALVLLALLVDGGIAINARERAANVAEQAARAAANDVNVTELRAGNPHVVIGPDACAAAANVVGRYPMGSNMTASMTGCNAPDGGVTATVGVSVRTKLLFGFFGNGFTMTTTASATPVCGITAGGQC
jgi:Flp pilus assembly protein TadG